MKINMSSRTFSHDICSIPNKKPKQIEWDFFSKKNPMTFYIDGDVALGINDREDGKMKFLWTLESPYYNLNCFDFIKNNLDIVLETYELIFTYNEDLLKIHPKFKWIPAMGTWIKNPEITRKNKLISMITSTKRYTPQQRLRVDFAKKESERIEIFGKGFRPIKDKEIGLNDYMFSVCVENETCDTYFTEKILDCFATGTIPIYKGTKQIGKFFDENGIIFLDEVNLNNLSSNLYHSKLESINNNFEKLQKFLVPEDFIFENYLINYSN